MRCDFTLYLKLRLLLISELEKSQFSTLLPLSRSPDISEPIKRQRCKLDELIFSCRFFNPERSASTQFPLDIFSPLPLSHSLRTDEQTLSELRLRNSCYYAIVKKPPASILRLLAGGIFKKYKSLPLNLFVKRRKDTLFLKVRAKIILQHLESSSFPSETRPE